MRGKTRCAALWAAALLAVLLLAGCEQKTINDLMAEPGKYANKEVGLTGTVTRSFSLLGKGAYEIEDGTGKLWVVSGSGVPRKGAKVAVKGKVRDAYDLSNFGLPIPDAFSSGMVLVESGHKAQ